MIYEYKCPDCKHITEVLCKLAERTESHPCEGCGIPAPIILSLPAFTPRLWGDSHGYYDGSLGTYVKNSQHRDKILDEKGLVAESDLPSGFADSKIQDSINDKKAHDKNVSRFETSMKDHGDVGRAFADTFPAEEIL